MRYTAVFDTNILISALLSTSGNPFRCLALAKIGQVESVTCQQILSEFSEKLVVKFKFSQEMAQAALLNPAMKLRGGGALRAPPPLNFIAKISNAAQAAVEEVRSFSRLVEISTELRVVSADSDDDMVVECAVVGGATYIVTGDKHFLSLGKYKLVTIIKATEFVALLSQS